jgi:hypothetical protein
MPAIPTVGGVAYFWAGGRQLRVRGDFKVQPNNFQWEGVAGQDAWPQACTRHPDGRSGYFR